MKTRLSSGTDLQPGNNFVSCCRTHRTLIEDGDREGDVFPRPYPIEAKRSVWV